MGDYVKAQSRDVHTLELKNEKKLRNFARLVDIAENRRDQILDKGVLKIHTPRAWAANQMNFRDMNHHFTTQYETWQPCVDPQETGCFIRVTEGGNPATQEEFQAHVMRRARQPDSGESGRMTVRRFFPRRQRHLEERVVSGTVPGSRFSEYADSFSLRNLRSILSLGTLRHGQLRQESGITMPEIVYGSYGSTIPFQTGYIGLYTVAYHHGGKPRAKAGDILVILPKAYFMAFNCGFNMVESMQFATPRWIEIGKRRLQTMCVCRPVWLNPNDLDAAYIEYQRRRQLERAIRRLTEEIGRLRAEPEEEQRRCPLRHPHRLRQRRASANVAQLAGKKMTTRDEH